MNEREQRALLVALMKQLREKGSWCGETHLQKATYLAQELLKVPLAYSFRLYKHGPYSFDLRDELAAMRADDIVELRYRTYPYGPTLEPTGRGRDLIDAHDKLLEKYIGSLRFIADWFDDKGVKQLERLSTGYMVTLEMSGASESARADQLRRLKPHISMPLAIGAMKEVDEMAQAAADSMD